MDYHGRKATKARRRPEHVSQPLGQNAPTFRVALSALQNQERPAPRDPGLCDAFSGADRCCDKAVGALATGEPRCELHLSRARWMGLGVVTWPQTTEEVKA